MPVAIPPVTPSRTLLRDLARERLRDAILHGELQPGEHLHDTELCSWLGCSRTPIRDAINDLVRTGLVELEANRFTRVAAPRPEHAVPGLQALGMLFGGPVRSAVPALGTGPRRELVRAIGRAIDALDGEEVLPATSAAVPVYGQILAACRNPVLTTALQTVTESFTFRLRLDTSAAPLPWARMRHAALAFRAAIADRDTEGAVRAFAAIHLLPAA